jgi:hypothetical protein
MLLLVLVTLLHVLLRGYELENLPHLDNILETHLK